MSLTKHKGCIALMLDNSIIDKMMYDKRINTRDSIDIMETTKMYITVHATNKLHESEARLVSRYDFLK